MKELTVKIEVDDNFEPGECYHCPMSYESDYEDDGCTETQINCIFGCGYWDKCPLCEEK